jgi:toxin-antitoxin system PIN domain toxin
MSGYLLDINLLIALLWPSHESHELTVRWFARRRGKGWATCPLTESGFVRIVSNPAFSRDAVQPREAAHVLSRNTVAKDHVFWPDDVPYAEAVAFAGARLMGHQQVTDTYLLGLAVRHNGVLATLDRRAETVIDARAAERKSLEVVS